MRRARAVTSARKEGREGRLRPNPEEGLEARNPVLGPPRLSRDAVTTGVPGEGLDPAFLGGDGLPRGAAGVDNSVALTDHIMTWPSDGPDEPLRTFELGQIRSQPGETSDGASRERLNAPQSMLVS